MIEPTVVPSIQPLAIDELLRRQELGQDAVLGRRVGGGAEADDRVRGERDAMRRTASATQPKILIALVISITRPFGIESAKAPTTGASTT